MSATSLAKAIKLTPPRSHALRQKLRVDADPQCMHTFAFGKSKHPMFSDNALVRMRAALAAESKAEASPTELEWAPKTGLGSCR
jgi:hypothetical protein